MIKMNIRKYAFCASYCYTVDPPPPSPIHLHPAYFNPNGPFATPSTLLEPKYRIPPPPPPNPTPTNSKLSVLTENWLTWYLDVADSESGLNFLEFGSQNQFCDKFGPFCLKISAHGISRMLIFISTVVFWISNPKFIFRQICVEKFKVVCFAEKFADIVSRRCWFLFGH